MNRKLLALGLVFLMIALPFALLGCSSDDEEPEETSSIYSDFVSAVDPDYGYNVALELATNPDLLSSNLGTRTAGSDAEHAAADWLVSAMEEIGLQDVEKVAVDVDKWQFNGASVVLEDDDYVIDLHSYATGSTPEEGITAQVIYVGKGTMWDYEDVDASGKIVMVEVDQRSDWWVTYPQLEAEYQGAVAVMAASVDGFSAVSDDAYNANDICGPVSIPCTSITVKDSNYVKEKLAEGPVTATIKVDNIVEEDGTGYNVMGRIPGKNSDEMIIYGAHYDMYFAGFQDNSCAVGASMSIAKAMIDSGYTPERDIVFVMHCAEEWGASETQYDWCTGAWRMINEAHPEWAGKTLAFINFELPAYEFDTYTSVVSAPEMYTMIDKFVNEEPSPEPINCFPDGVKTAGYQTYTYSDDFSYYAAGVPSTVNGFLLTEDGDDVFDFYYDRYHTNYDVLDTYNEDVFRFSIEFYGAFGIYIDSTPALQLDFTNQYDRLVEALDETVLASVDADPADYSKAVEEYGQQVKALYTEVERINTEYKNKVSENADVEELEGLWEEARALNAINLSLFKDTQDALLGLMYERPIVPHEAAQENIDLMQKIVALLEEGDAATAVDEYVWAVNNVNEWNAMFFSEAVTAQFNEMLWGEKNKVNNNLFWGTGKDFVPAQVEEATRSLTVKAEEPEGASFDSEIAVYEQSIIDQTEVLMEKLAEEAGAIGNLAERIKRLF